MTYQRLTKQELNELREEMRAYLEAAKEENDPSLLAAVMEDIHRIEARQSTGDSQ